MDFLWGLAAKRSETDLEGERSPWQRLHEEACALWSFGDSSPSTAGPTATTTTTTTASITDSINVSPLNALFEDPWGFDALAKEAQEVHEERHSRKSSQACRSFQPPPGAESDARDKARQAALTSQLSECLLRLELAGVEVTDMPHAVYFKILVDHLGRGRSHSVMKTHLDLAGLQATLCEELPSVRLPPLPCPKASLPLTSRGFGLSLGEYLLSICSSRDLARACAVKTFFQLTDDYLRTPRPEATPRKGACPAEPRLVTRTRVEADDVDPKQAGSESPVLPLMQNLRPLGRPTDGRPLPSRSDLREDPGQLAASPSTLHTIGASDSPKLEARGPLPAQTVSSPPLVIRPSSSSRPTLADRPSLRPCKTHGMVAQHPADKPPLRPCKTHGVVTNHLDEPGTDRDERGRHHTYCVICWGALTEIAIDPCGHLCLCATCAGAVDLCPVCRGPVGKLLKVFVP